MAAILAPSGGSVKVAYQFDNRAKTDMTHDEFITLCRLIVQRADGLRP